MATSRYINGGGRHQVHLHEQADTMVESPTFGKIAGWFPHMKDA